MTAIKSTFAASFWQPKPLNGATEHDYTAATIALDVIKDGDLVGQEVFPPSNNRYLKGHRRNFADNGTPIVLRA